jgi:hypothetical protein
MVDFSSERPSAGVPRELPLDGLSPADLAQLGVGDFNMERNTMFAGYKTYFVAAVMFMLGVVMVMGVDVPEEVWMMLGAVGLGTLRAAVEGAKEEVKDEVKAKM